MGPAVRFFLVSATAVVLVLQGCSLVEGAQYTNVSVETAEYIAINAYCLAQAAYSVKVHTGYLDDSPCRLAINNVDVSPDKSALGLTKSDLIEYLVQDYNTLTEYIMAGQQYCYFVYLNRSYTDDPNADCIGICERLLNQSRTVAAQARRIILGLGCASPSPPLACSGMSFLPTFTVNSTVYGTITSMHNVADGILHAACNLEQSINGYKFAEETLGLASSGGSPVERICVTDNDETYSGQDSDYCPKCNDHLFEHQCQL